MGKKRYILMNLGLAAVLTACSSPEDSAPPVINPENIGKEGPEEAFLHEDPVGDIFADGRQVSATVGSRLHACGKVRYAALGRVLQSRGVNLANAAADSAGLLYRSGNLSLGAPNYEARSGEPDRNTTGGITRLYDILIASADEMIANMPAREECKVNGVGAKLFDDKGCNADGFACMLGMPVSDVQMTLCNDMVSDFGADKAQGQRLAVAALAAPVFLCD
jgi:hypothetical protein